MQRKVETAPSPNRDSFAGLMASLAEPAQKKAQAPAVVWTDDGLLDDLSDDLADDVATISYEQSLRSNARYHAPANKDQSLNSDRSLTDIPTPALKPMRTREEEEDAVMAARKAAIVRLAMEAGAEAEAEAKAESEAKAAAKFEFKAEPQVPQAQPAKERVTQSRPKANDRNLKRSSITIRLSKMECQQLQQRANEAELTVSAYLRSCVFEVETLRAQVKQMLSQMRLPEPIKERPVAPPPPPPAPARRPWTLWPNRS